VQARGLDLNAAQGKSEYAKRLLPIIAQVKDGVQRTHYAQVLARRVRSDERVISEQLQAFEKGDSPVRVNRPARELPARPNAARYDEYLIMLALRTPDLLNQVSFISPEDFEQPDVREVWQALVRYNTATISFDSTEFVRSLTPAARETGERLRDASNGIQFNDAEAPRELEAAAYRLQLQRYQNELTQLHHLLTDAPAEEQPALTRRVSTLSGLIAQTKRALDARTIIKPFSSRRDLS
jgi:DNA primase